MLHRKEKNEQYHHILQKANQRLASWKAKYLAFVRRITLAQSVIQVIHAYTMQSITIPNTTCDELEKVQSKFIRNDGEAGKGWHTISWKVFGKSKKDSGMGFKKLHSFNKAFMMKLAWEIIDKPNDL